MISSRVVRFFVWAFVIFSFYVLMYILGTFVLVSNSCKSAGGREFYFSGPLIRYAKSQERYSEIAKSWSLARVALHDGRCSVGVAMIDGSGGVTPEMIRAFADFVVFYDADDVKQRICEDNDFSAFNYSGTSVIVLCDSFYRLDERGRALIVIHEIAHASGMRHGPEEGPSIDFHKSIINSCGHLFESR